MLFLEEAGLAVFEEDECRDAPARADRRAQHGSDVQGPRGLQPRVKGIIQHAPQQHALAGLEDAVEQVPAEASGFALELARLESMEDAIGQLAGLGDLDEQATLGAGLGDRLLEDGAQHHRGLGELAHHPPQSLDQRTRGQRGRGSHVSSVPLRSRAVQRTPRRSWRLSPVASGVP
jgi:hypothetical protein